MELRDLKHEEHQYLQIVRELLAKHDTTTNSSRTTRNNAKTVACFGKQTRWNLQNGIFPLLTTKRVFFRGVVEELLWFIRGSTDAKQLQEKNIHIWDGHSSRSHLDSVGLQHYREGDCGPIYGFQWRHSGAQYMGCDADYTGQGVDQLGELIENLKNDPYSRRHVLTSWVPSDLDKMALNPCHCMCQFYVDEDGFLECMMYQRSADIGLGVPFNIASYAILTRLIASCAGLKPGRLLHVIGDCHIYEDHIDALRTQVNREPYEFPQLFIKNEENLKSVDDLVNLKFEDFSIIGYKYHPSIKMKMVV